MGQCTCIYLQGLCKRVSPIKLQSNLARILEIQLRSTTENHTDGVPKLPKGWMCIVHSITVSQYRKADIRRTLVHEGIQNTRQLPQLT